MQIHPGDPSRVSLVGMVKEAVSHSGKSTYLHKRVDDVILAAVKVLQQAALEVGAD